MVLVAWGGVWAEVVSLAGLAGVLVFSTMRPRGLPEAVLAVPVAGVLVGLGVVTPERAVRQMVLLGPTVGFLAAILLLAHLADAEGVFRWLGDWLGVVSRGRARRLLVVVFGAASVTTAVLSLDATVVLLTPVVFATASRLRVRARPHVYACTHLANSASLLLPVSNLTNLLAFAASGLSFARFAALMGPPWLVAIGVEYLVLRRFFRADLVGAPPREDAVPRVERPVPLFAFVVLALTLAGFGVSGLLGVAPVWVAVGGAAVLAARSLVRREIGVAGLVRAASPLFCVFVLALGVVVASVSDRGLGRLVAALLPSTADLVNLLVVAAIAAVLANLVNNLPATLLLVAAMGAGTHPGLVLAVLIGVNIGPNLTYVGSLATLLWRRVLAHHDVQPELGEFWRLGVATVPACLLAAVAALWLGLTWWPPGPG